MGNVLHSTIIVSTCNPTAMRPLLLGTLILLCLPSLLAQTVIVEEDDPSLVYVPPIGSWNFVSGPQPGPPNGSVIGDYFHAGGYRAYDFEGGSITFKFNGSYIAYYSDLFRNHGKMEVDLDGVKTAFSTYSPLSFGTPHVNLFEAHVDPNIPDHIIKLTNLENKTMGFDYILYTVEFPMIQHPDSSSSPVTDNPTHSSSQTAPTSTPAVSPRPQDHAPTSRVPQHTTDPIIPKQPGGPSTVPDHGSPQHASSLSGTAVVLVTVAVVLVVSGVALIGILCLRLRRRRVNHSVAEDPSPRFLRNPRTSHLRTVPFVLLPGPGTPTVEKRPSSQCLSPMPGQDSERTMILARSDPREVPPPYVDHCNAR